MSTEDLLIRIRSLPVRLRFHFLLSFLLSPERCSEIVSMLENSPIPLPGLMSEVNLLPPEVRTILISSEYKNLLLDQKKDE